MSKETSNNSQEIVSSTNTPESSHVIMDNGEVLSKEAAENKVNDRQNSRWNRQLNKTKDRLKNSKTYNNAKQRFNHSDIGKIARAATGKNSSKGLLKSLNVYKNAHNKVLKLKKLAISLLGYIKIISMVLLITLVSWVVIVFGISIMQSIGETPHYYCDIEADEGIKRSGLYQQYCANGGSGFNLDNINGHYIMQDGSGPCTDCACLNLLLRYYTSKEINFYDYLWDETGQYSNDNGANSLDCSPNGNNMRSYIAQAGSTTCHVKNPHLTNGSFNFTKKNANPNNWDATKANWGYVRDDTLNFEGQTNPYKSLTDNENWVWDLSPETTWSAKWTSGNYVNIEDIKATWKHVDGTWGTGDELRKLLDKHPSGVVVYRNYGSGNHAILVTGYDDNGFKVVDSALGTAGGFEGPASSSNFCWQGCWSNKQLEHPVGVLSYTYIEEDSP